jgi:hypothetical protein
MAILLFLKRYWQWAIVLCGMATGQFVLLQMRAPATFFYDATMPQIRTVLPNIGPLE